MRVAMPSHMDFRNAAVVEPMPRVGVSFPPHTFTVIALTSALSADTLSATGKSCGRKALRRSRVVASGGDDEEENNADADADAKEEEDDEEDDDDVEEDEEE